MKGLYVNTTDMSRSLQQMESSDGGIIPGLLSGKIHNTFWYYSFLLP